MMTMLLLLCRARTGGSPFPSDSAPTRFLVRDIYGTTNNKSKMLLLLLLLFLCCFTDNFRSDFCLQFILWRLGDVQLLKGNLRGAVGYYSKSLSLVRDRLFVDSLHRMWVLQYPGARTITISIDTMARAVVVFSALLVWHGPDPWILWYRCVCPLTCSLYVMTVVLCVQGKCLQSAGKIRRVRCCCCCCWWWWWWCRRRRCCSCSCR